VRRVVCKLLESQLHKSPLYVPALLWRRKWILKAHFVFSTLSKCAFNFSHYLLLLFFFDNYNRYFKAKEKFRSSFLFEKTSANNFVRVGNTINNAFLFLVFSNLDCFDLFRISEKL